MSTTIPPTIPFDRVRLGKLAPRHDPRTLKLAKYTANLIPAPATCDLTNSIHNLGMMLNDNLGCCVCSSNGHTIQTRTAEAGAQFIPPDSAIETMYEQACGYDPANPATDQGCIIANVNQYWQKTGIAGHKISAYLALSVAPSQALQQSSIWADLEKWFEGLWKNHPDIPTNNGMPLWQRQIMQSVYYFGAASVGVQLPLTAQGQTSWDVVSTTGNGEPGSWGGHGIPVVSYSPSGVTVITWGSLLNASWDFLAEYMDEAWVTLASDIFTTEGASPEGFNLEQLRQDLTEITN